MCAKACVPIADQATRPFACEDRKAKEAPNSTQNAKPLLATLNPQVDPEAEALQVSVFQNPT